MLNKKTKTKREEKVSSKASIEEFAPNMESGMQAPNRLNKKIASKISSNKKVLLIVLAVLVGLGVIAFGAKSYISLRNTQKELEAMKNNPNAKDKEEAQKIVEQVGKLVILPEGEEPTVATVTDPSKLNDQPFFANSAAGDKVLIYQDAKRAILYRPSQNKVIEIAPLNLDGVGENGIAGEDIMNPKGDTTDTKSVNSNTKTTNTGASSNKNTNSVNKNTNN